MNAMDDLEDHDLRRRQLAKRMVAHQARTQTIYDFTGYTARRQWRLRQRWGVPPDARHRGPAPTSFAFCFGTLRGRAEASSALIFCSMFGAVPRRHSDARRQDQFLSADRRGRGPRSGKSELFSARERGTNPSPRSGEGRAPRSAKGEVVGEVYANLETGERLCEAYEAFRACFPWTSIEFEQFKLLANGLWSGELLQLRSCACSAATLVDRLTNRRHQCPTCRRRELNGVAAAAASDVLGDALKEKKGQGELF